MGRLKPRRRLRLPGIALGLACMTSAVLLTSACRNASDTKHPANSAQTGAALEIAATPPYSTKEPDTYQARYVTYTDPGGPSSPLSAVAGSMKIETFVARNGADHRQDFELAPGVTASYLQNS